MFTQIAYAVTCHELAVGSSSTAVTITPVRPKPGTILSVTTSVSSFGEGPVFAPRTRAPDPSACLPAGQLAAKPFGESEFNSLSAEIS